MPDRIEVSPGVFHRIERGIEVEYLKVTQQRRGAFFEALPAPGGAA